MILYWGTFQQRENLFVEQNPQQFITVIPKIENTFSNKSHDFPFRFVWKQQQQFLKKDILLLKYLSISSAISSVTVL